MEQTKKDLENIKIKLLEYIKSNYEKEKAEQFTKNINSMGDKEFIEFLKKQGILKEEGESKPNCIFCSIIYGDTPSTKIGENDSAIAILDINPASLGHTLIIPKEHLESIDKIDKKTKELIKTISMNLTQTFKPKKIEEIEDNIMGHTIINLLPIYDKETINSERKPQSPEKLEEIKKKIKNSKPEQIEQKEPENIIKPEINEKNTWLPKRIP